ncbi:MAG TPA: flagellar motor protein PomA [Pseudomonadales bacterium]|nr:flagellar motor protein PomA [Pseudomonadales bacterium]
MDLATLVGIVGGFIIVTVAMFLSSNGVLGMFGDLTSVLIVVVGTILVTMANFGLSQFLGALKVAGKAFVVKSIAPLELIAEIVGLADSARKGGLLTLEGKEVSNDFLAYGIQLLVDGHDASVVRNLLETDMYQTIDRHDSGVKIFRVMADLAPAMGMIGTLVGLVAMLSNMDDPKAIGPAMAVALLTTLYGAMIANMVAIPIANKLELRSKEEALSKGMMIDGLIGIQAGQNPKIIDAMLKNYLPSNQRASEDD